MLIYMLSAEQIKLLEGYRDKAYICNILCDESFNYYSFIKTLINLPLILSSTIMTVLNSSDFDPLTMRIPNIILNASTSLILSLINNYKLPEKCQTFRNKANKYMHLTNSIEDSLTNELNEINIDKIRNFINDYDTISESLEYSYPTHIKNRVRKKYKNTKTLPNSLNMVGTFIILTQPSTPSSSNNTSDDYPV